MPLEVQVGSAKVRVESRDVLQTVEVSTENKPEAAVLDPDLALFESTRENNRRIVEGR